ncbi:3'-5' RNA helicase ythdc2 [Sparganum proliferum]
MVHLDAGVGVAKESQLVYLWHCRQEGVPIAAQFVLRLVGVRARPSPLSVLSNNGEGTPSDLKVLPSDWVVFDKIIGQRLPYEDTSRINLGVGHGKYNSGRGRQSGQRLSGRSTAAPKVVPHCERKLLTCVTMISPITAAILSGPVRTKITCVPSGGSGRNDPFVIVEDEDTSPSESLEKEEKAPIIPKQIRPYLSLQDNAVENIEKEGQRPSRVPSRYQALQREIDGAKRVTVYLDGPNGILTFDCELEVAKLVVDLRQKWNCLLLRRLRNPSKQSPQQDEAILSTIVAVLTAEEQVLGLRQPSGVGARPRPMVTELCNYLESGNAPAESSRLSGLDNEQPGKSWTSNNPTDRNRVAAPNQFMEIPGSSQSNNFPATGMKYLDGQNQMCTELQWSQTFIQPKTQPFQGTSSVSDDSHPPMPPQETLMAGHCGSMGESSQTNLEDDAQEDRFDSQFPAYQEMPPAMEVQDQYAWPKTTIVDRRDCLAQSFRKATLDSVQESNISNTPEARLMSDFQQNSLVHHERDTTQEWESQFYTYLTAHIDGKGAAFAGTEKLRQIVEANNDGHAANGERIQSKSSQNDRQPKLVGACNIGMITTDLPNKKQPMHPYVAEIKYSKGFRF